MTSPGTELATAYVSLVVESSQVAKQVSASLNGVEAQADKAGKGIGSKLASGIGSTFKVAGAGLGLVAGAAIGTAFTKGFNRMVTIDDAKGKLAGLGHQTEGIAAIMASANESVKGTAFGMGEAATAAASAVAAGIKQGEDLTKYLKLVGDTATIAGTDLASMGSIFGKVQTSGKAYTDTLNQLADRGIPIFQWLQDEYGVSSEALSDMVKKGKVDAETFRGVIEKNIGGAALKSGETLRGGWKNMQAALGRIGEAALSPFLPMMKSSLGGITEWADRVKPHVQRAAQYLATGITEMTAAFRTHGDSIEGPASNWEKFGSKARFAADGLKGIYALLKDGQYLGASMTFGIEEDSKIVDWVLRFREAISKLVDSVKSKDLDGVKDFFNSLRGGQVDGGAYTKVNGIGKTLAETFTKLGDAAKTVGKSLGSIIGDTGVVGSVIIEHFARGMALLAENTWLVTAALTAYAASLLAAKVIHVAYEASRVAQSIMLPAQIASQWAMVRAITAHSAVMRTYLASVGHEVAATQGAIASRYQSVRAWTAQTYSTNLATSALGRYSALTATAAASTTGLTGALLRGTAAATAFGARVQAVGATAIAGVRNAASGMVSMLGGPWMAAVLAAGIAVWKINSDLDAHKARLEGVTNSWQQLAKTQGDMAAALLATDGELTGDALANLSQQVRELDAALAAGAANRTAWSEWRALTQAPWNDSIKRENNIADQYQAAQDALNELNMSHSALTKALSTNQGFAELEKKLRATGDGSEFALKHLNFLRGTYLETQQAAQNSTQGFGSLTQAIKTLADETATADDRFNALKRALDGLADKPVQLDDAMASYNKSIRDVVKSTEQAWNASDGFGEALINSAGGIDTTTANGDKLRTVLIDLRDESARVAAAGGDMAPVWERNEQVLADLARATGLTVEQIKSLATSVSYLPKEIELLIAAKGADKAKQDLTVLQTLLAKNSDGVTIDTRLTGSADVIKQIQDAGGVVTQVTGSDYEFKVDAPSVPGVMKVIEDLLKKINDLPSNKTVKVTYQEATADGTWRAPMRLPQQRAAGGPIFGAGGPTSDSIPAFLSAGEHVLTAQEVANMGGHQGVYNLRAMARAGGLAFAEGGTPDFVSKAVSAARGVEGNAYAWGGTGPTRFDCSGFVGWLQQILMGLEGSAKRLYTTHSLLGGATAGLESGLGPAGTWFQVGVSQDHMAGTLAGMPVESGGAFGTSGIGGNRAKATDGQFPYKFHLPNELIKNYGSLTRGGKLVEWTDEDERDLERARIAVAQAKERRDEVYGTADSSDSERRLADLDVADAEAKVIKQQGQKDKQGTLEGGDRVAPQAPALTEAYNAEKAARIDALQAVEDANARRNEVYDDPSATELEKAKADQALAKAQEEANSVSNSAKSTATTVKGVFENFASSAAGILFDSAKEIFLPDTVADSHWWDVADEAVSAASETDVDALVASVPSFENADIMKQLGYNGDVPDWAKPKPKPEVKVFDSGGWLEPGEMGINLSSKPEPIFNSPAQLAQFAGGFGLQAPTGMYSSDAFDKMNDTIERLEHAARQPNVTIQSENINQGLRKYGDHQRNMSRTYMRR
ncbi:tape measure protein [Nocardia sp. NPDC058176]|uniref:tape measure protein n=1 Tax=Nocardia sp. NPDC058176 TaxID=3346368 RepID=UPI0036DCA175